MLRRCIPIILILTLIATSFVYSIAQNRQVTMTLMQIPVTLNEISFRFSHEFEPYPFIINWDANSGFGVGYVYIPLTYHMLNLMNMTLSRTADGGFVIGTGDPEVPKPFSFEMPLDSPNDENLMATVISSRITINGNVINNNAEPSPLLLFRDVVYFPLTARFVEEFGWYSFMNRSGLHVWMDNSFYITGVRVMVNGRPLRFDQPPIIENDRTLVPLRTIFEALGANVEWEQSTQTVTATRDDITVTLTIGSDILYRNGEQVLLYVPAKLVGDRTLVPTRAVSEAFGAQVEWLPERIVWIYQPGKEVRLLETFRPL